MPLVEQISHGKRVVLLEILVVEVLYLEVEKKEIADEEAAISVGEGQSDHGISE